MASSIRSMEAAGGKMQEAIPAGLVVLGDSNLNDQGQLPDRDFSWAAQEPYQDIYGVSVW